MPPATAALCYLLLLPAQPAPADHVLRTDGKASLHARGVKVVKGAAEMPYSDLLTLEAVVEGGPGLEVDAVAADADEKAWRRSGRQTPRVTHPSPGRTVWRQAFEFEPVRPGKLTAPTLSLRYREGAEGKWRAVRWADVPVEVVGPEDADQKDIRGELPIETLPEEPSWTRHLPWLAGAVAGVATAALAVVFLRRPRRRPAPPPDRWALGELDRLEAAGVPPGAPPDWFHTQVSAILRKYIEERYSLRASRQTTEEFLAEVGRGSHLDGGQQATLRELLPLCDLAKFTGLPPSEVERAEVSALARRFVLQSAPRP